MPRRKRTNRPPPARTAPPVDVATLARHISNFLGQSGFPVRDYTVGGIFGTPAAEGNPTALGLALPGQVDFGGAGATGAASAASRYGQRGRLSQEQVDGLRVMLHEGMHQMRYGRTPEVIDGQPGRDFEEGATEATTQDLLPILTAKMYGHKMPGAKAWNRRAPAYEPQVTNIRQLSVFGSGSKDFDDHAARVWRRSFQHADKAGREKMRAAALAAKDAILARRSAAR